METLGRKRWATAEGYIPSQSTGPHPQMTSHETACILNAGNQDVHAITIFYGDRPPVGPYRILVPAQRTQHLRFNDLTDPAPIPRAPTTGACSNPVYRLSSNTRAWIPDKRRTRC